jgi:hypothetical protein
MGSKLCAIIEPAGLFDVRLRKLTGLLQNTIYMLPVLQVFPSFHIDFAHRNVASANQKHAIFLWKAARILISGSRKSFTDQITLPVGRHFGYFRRKRPKPHETIPLFSMQDSTVSKDGED